MLKKDKDRFDETLKNYKKNIVKDRSNIEDDWETDHDDLILYDLIGEKIIEVYLNDENDCFKFVLESGQEVFYQSEGDCCNWVFFNSINGIDALLNEEIINVKESVWSDISEPAFDHDVLEVKFYTIITNKGYFDIELRNAHNGYYGGRITKANSYVMNKSDFRLIKGDF